jgi:hypothetical protein
MTNAEIDMAEEGALALLKIGSVIDPEVGLAAPLIAKVITFGFHALKSGIASGNIIPDGAGGFVTKAWADDPRHQLNPDGSFKF